MTRSIYKQVSNEISENIILKSPIYESLDIYNVIEQYETKNDIYLEENDYNKIASLVKTNLNKYIKYRKSKRSIIKFKFSNTDKFTLIGISKDDKRFKCYNDYYYKLIQMNDLLFEKFSAKYINLLLCDFSLVSRKSADGGIDFLGNGNFQKLLTIEGVKVDLKSKDFIFKVIGQSKRYVPKNKIGTKEIREFLGSVKILQDALNPRKVSAWFGEISILSELRMADPFLYLFITTSHYTKDAIELSQQLGIYIIDIDDIIFDLITNNIAIKDDKLNYAKFVHWIEKKK